MRTKTLLIVGLLVALSLAFAIWIAVAERPHAAVARDAELAQRPLEIVTPAAVEGERVEAPVEPAPAEPAVSSSVSAAAPEREAPARQRVWLAVVDHDGEPVIGAEVALSGRIYPLLSDRTPIGRTGVGGRIELALEGTNEKYVRAFTLDHASSGWASLSKLELDASQARVLVLERMAHVVGLVLDTDGSPIPRATVEWRIATYKFGAVTAEVPPQLATDDRGRFESYIEGFGTAFNAVASSEERRGQPHEVHPEPGQEIALTLHVGDELTVSGVVTAPDGSVAANASVSIRGDRSTDLRIWSQGQNVPCDELGRFSCKLQRAGKYEAFAFADAWASSEIEPFELGAGATSVVLTLRLVPPATITGRVVRDDGSPVVGVEVVAHHERCIHCAANSLIGAERLGILRATTDADGHFVFAPARVDVHLYTVGCSPDRERPKAVIAAQNIAAGARDVSLVVTEAALVGSVFEGHVHLEDTGAPLTKMLVQVYRWRDPTLLELGSESIESADGYFRIESLRPGSDYCARINNVAGYLPVVVERWTASLDSKVVDLTMLRPRVLDVTVTDEHGAKLSNAVVRFTANHPGYEAFLVNKTDRDGFARMNFWPGAFSISASLGERRSEPMQIVIADRNAPLTLVVPSK